MGPRGRSGLGGRPSRRGRASSSRFLDFGQFRASGARATIGRVRKRNLGGVVADWIGAELTVPVGQGAGEPFPVWPWQRKALRGIFADGVQTASVSVPRGNGKTTLLAAVGVAAIAGPLARPRTETVIIGPSFTVARETFVACRDMLTDRAGGELDRKRWRVWDGQNVCAIECRATGAKVRTVGSDPRRLHGIRAAGLLILDEVAQWEPRVKRDRAFSALRTSLGKCDGCRMVIIGTRAADPSHFFELLLQGGADFSLSYAIREGENPFSARVWRRVNPSWNYLPNVRETVRRKPRRRR